MVRAGSLDYAKATDVLDGSTTGLSMSYNPQLKKYIVAYSTFFEPNTVKLRTADRPEGPWSDPQNVYNLPVPKSGANYAVYLHPEYDPTGKNLYISYLFGEDGNIHMVQLAIAPPNAITLDLPDVPQGTSLYQGGNSCKVQSGFKTNTNYKACIVQAASPLTITSNQFRSISTPNLKICITALNTDQRPVQIDLRNNNNTIGRAQLTFGSEGIAKILACSSVNVASSFDSVVIHPTSAGNIYVSNITLSSQ